MTEAEGEDGSGMMESGEAEYYVVVVKVMPGQVGVVEAAVSQLATRCGGLRRLDSERELRGVLALSRP